MNYKVYEIGEMAGETILQDVYEGDSLEAALTAYLNCQPNLREGWTTKAILEAECP